MDNSNGGVMLLTGAFGLLLAICLGMLPGLVIAKIFGIDGSVPGDFYRCWCAGIVIVIVGFLGFVFTRPRKRRHST